MTEYTLSSYNSLLLLRVVLVTDDDVVGVVLMMGFSCRFTNSRLVSFLSCVMKLSDEADMPPDLERDNSILNALDWINNL